MLKYNWHTHTKRCGHARGTDEEYVKEAIAAGIEKLGFSDHACYPGVWGNGQRMNYKEYDGYVASIKELKERYKEQIDIYTGMEIECVEEHLDTLIRFRKEMDYMILGQHCFVLDNDESYYITSPGGLERYCDLLEKACEKGLADCIAHPDVCLYSYPQIDEAVTKTAERIGDLALRYDLPVEINCGSGVRRGKVPYDDGERYPYPVREFFRVFAEKGCDVIIGLDIHDPLLFRTDEYIDRALSVVEGLPLNIISEYEMIEAAKARKEKYGYAAI